jgi:D-3-phosphoglycerate dehydrogenase
LPHLGASTREAEENCAIMVAEQVRDYLESGNISNSVNFPDVSLSRSEGFRLAVVNRNVPNMVGQISTDLGRAGLNILDMINKSRGDMAYTLVDVDAEVPDSTVRAIAEIDGVLAVRRIGLWS